jgi:hypothetical protein
LNVLLNLSLLLLHGIDVDGHRGIDVAGRRLNSRVGHCLSCGSNVSPSLAAICS